MKDIIIEVKHVVKTYKTTRAVDDLSFEVYDGEIFGLLGPNGAGKTTTIEMLVGLRKPDEGTATLAGYDVIKQIDYVKDVIGVQLQSTSLFELLTIREILEMYASFYFEHVDIDNLIKEMLLEEKKKDRVKNLSGGQKQRLAIALALVHDPKIIFLDEPTTGLDPQARRTLWDIIISLKQRGKTIVLTTHYMDEAHVLCDRIGIVDRGKLIALDTPNALVKMLSSNNAITFRQNEGDYSIFLSLPTAQKYSVTDNQITLYTNCLQETLVELITLANEENIVLHDLQTRTATLEDVFIQFTGRSLREE
ncbi:MAG: ABC transporter ATP-binding protein [Bacillaceae bacterium]